MQVSSQNNILKYNIIHRIMILIKVNEINILSLVLTIEAFGQVFKNINPN